MAAAALALAAAALALAAAAPPDAHATEATLSECARLSVPVTNVESIRILSPNGTYAVNDTIDIQVRVGGEHGYSSTLDTNPSSDWHVLSHTMIKLETGRIDGFAKFKNVTTHNAHYNYTIQPGHESRDLDYHSSKALYWNVYHNNINYLSAFDGESNYMGCGLPEPGGPGSLSSTSDISFDFGAPYPVNASSPDEDGTYGTGRILNITVSLDEPAVITGGEPSLMLNTAPPRNASYAGGNGTAELSFLYTVQPGDTAARLDYAGEDALYLPPGSSVADGMNNNASALPLPEPGKAGSLGASKSIGVLGGPLPVLKANGSAVDDSVDSGSGYAQLQSAVGIGAFEEGDGAYALVASRGDANAGDDGIQLIRIHANGTIAAAGYATNNNPNFTMQNPTRVTVFKMGGLDRALVSSHDRIQLIDILPGGTLLASSSAAIDGSGFSLDNPTGVSMLGTEDSGDFAARAIVSTRDNPGGIQLVGILPNGTLLANGSAAHVANVFNLAGATGVDVLENDGGSGDDGIPPRAIVSSYGTDSIQLVSIRPNGNLTVNGSAIDGTNGFNTLNNPTGVDAFRMGGLDYAAVSSWGDNGIQLVRIEANGRLVAAGSAVNGSGGFDALGSAQAVKVFEMGGWAYALAISYGDNGIQLIRIHPDGSALYPAGSARDGIDQGFDALENAERVAVFDAGSRTYAFVTSPNDHAVQFVRLSPASVAGVSSHQGNGSHPAGDMINITVAFDERVILQDPANPPSLLLSLEGGDRAMPYLSGDGTDTLVFNYTVRDGDAVPASAAGLEYAHAGALVSRGAITDMLNNTADLELPAPGSPGSLGSARSIVPDTRGPIVESVSSPDMAGTYGVGSRINITVSFDEDVVVGDTGDDPSIALKVGDGNRSAMYDADGSAGRNLAFVYTVARGDNADDIDYANTTALSSGKAIADAVGNPADLTLPDPGMDGLLNGPEAIQIDTDGPRVVDATESEAKGVPYREGETIKIAVGFGEQVVLSGDARPSLRLALDGDDTAQAGYERQLDDGQTLVFNYTVRADDRADPLDYDGVGAMSLDAGTMRDSVGNDAVLDMPDAEKGDTLAAADIRIDTAAPTVDSVSSRNDSGTYGIGSRIYITVLFDEAVHVTGSPRIELDTGANPGMASYDAGSGSETLVFEYRVLPDDGADDLDYANTDALSLNGGTIRDAAGNDADRSLPEPGEAGSLAHSKDIAIDTTTAQTTDPPSVLKVFSDDAGGMYGTGSAINITVAFDGIVRVTGTPMLALSTNPARSAAYVGGSDGASRLAFLYTVQQGDSADRLDYASSNALSLNGGTIRDAVGRDARLELPPTGSSDSLYASGIVIDARRTVPAPDPAPDPTPDPTPDPGTNGGGGPGPGTNGTETGGAATVVFLPGEMPVQSNLTDRGNEVRVTINVTGLAGAGDAGGTVQFPSGGAVVATSFASVSFPPNVVATSVPSDGLLSLHVVAASDGLPPSSAIRGLAYGGSDAVVLRDIVEIGDENRTVTFSMPVRISLEGQAGGRAFYIEGGAGGQPRPIDAACAADDLERVHRHLNGTGECRIESADGIDMIIYTYHLTRFGTVVSDPPAGPPVYYTCSVGLGSPNLEIEGASPGGESMPAEQVLLNFGSASFERVGIEASPWMIDTGSSGPDAGTPSLPAPAAGTGMGSASSALVARIHASVPAAATQVSEDDGGSGAYEAVGADTEVAGGLGGGDKTSIWFKLNLAEYGNVQGGTISQSVTYNAQCVQP